MIQFNIYRFFFAVVAVMLVFTGKVSAQLNNDSIMFLNFVKKEFNTGFVAGMEPEREEFISKSELFHEELTNGSVSLFLERQNLFFLPFLQQLSEFRLLVGPVTGKGNIFEESATGSIVADRELSGIRGMVQGSSTNRFYFDKKNYTLVHLDAWATYSYSSRTDLGTVTDTFGVTTPYERESEAGKLRYGFNARAGWGIGRVQPVNHYMTSEWILEKYYPGRNFSEAEFMLVAKEIARIKHQRNIRTGNLSENEKEQLERFLNSRLFLETPEGMVNDYMFTEFRPRYHGTRVEFGPFFSYFNREPDFIYGGFLQFENAKYCNLKWNRNLSAKLSYNSYKHHDWMLLETNVGWNWYPSLRTEWGFGVKYIPGMTMEDFRDYGPVRHNFIPYVEYFSQISRRYRIESTFAWRVAPTEQFMTAGPEFSVSVYRSRY
jgi:hypothetical protein